MFIPSKFAYKHPTFGRSKIAIERKPYQNSVYYLWWEYLKRSEEYRKCCEANGKGKLKGLYADFGDVFSCDFKTWWQTDDRGARLFGEEQLPQFRIIDPKVEIVPTRNSVYIQVPLDLPKRFLMREFQKILDENHTGKRGIRTNRNSTSLYPVTGHVDIDALQKCLSVYDMKKQNPKMKLWEVAQECRVVKPDSRIKAGDEKLKGELLRKRLIAANTVSRLLKKAKKIIVEVSNGRFP